MIYNSICIGKMGVLFMLVEQHAKSELKNSISLLKKSIDIQKVK
jgi:hypothetical protein